MSDLIKHLKSFNRKERYWLLREAMAAAAFKLSEDFGVRLKKHIGITVPEDAFVAMDYHLDWLAMSIHLAEREDIKPSVTGQKLPKQEIPAGKFINTSQIDIDLLVAFDRGGTTHIVLVEAKFDTHWTNSQLREKVERLEAVFTEKVLNNKLVKPHFVLMSPESSENISHGNWPDWMKSPKGSVAWISLPKREGLRKLTRSDGNGKPSKDGGYIRIDPITPT